MGRGPGKQGSSHAELYREPLTDIKGTEQHWGCQPGAVRTRRRRTLAGDTLLCDEDSQTPSDPDNPL